MKINTENKKSAISHFRKFFVRTLHIRGNKAKRMALSATRMAKDLATFPNPPVEEVMANLASALTDSSYLVCLGVPSFKPFHAKLSNGKQADGIMLTGFPGQPRVRHRAISGWW